MKAKLTAILIVVAMRVAAAQDTVRLELQEAVYTALNNNGELMLAKLDQEGALSRFEQSSAVFLPQLKVSYTASVTNNPLNVFAFKLQQKNITQEDFNPQILNKPSAVNNYLAQVDLIQPVLNLDQLSRRKAASRQVEVYDYRRQRARQMVEFEVEKAYGQLQLARQIVIVTRESLNAMEQIYSRAKNYFDKGYLQHSDLLQISVQIATIEAQLSEANSNVRNGSDYLGFLMGMKRDVIFATTPLVKVFTVKPFETTVPDTRPDLMAMTSAMKAQLAMVQGERRSYLPRLNVFASYMINDKSVPGFGSGSYLAGAQLSFSIFEGTTRLNRVNEQRIAHAVTDAQLRLQKDKSQLELGRELRQLQDLDLTIIRYQRAADHAAEALKILQNRFEQGLVPTSDLLLAETTLSRQRLLLDKAVVDRNISVAYVKLLTSTPETTIK